MQRENDQGREPAEFANAKNEISDRLQKETQSAGEALHDARDEVVHRSGQYAADAQQALSEKAEETQRDVGSSLAALGGAMRVASDHLADKDQKSASKFMLDAAGGLEELSSSLREKPFRQVLEDVQSFGRKNPGMLIAGSVLAGLALGRFMKATSPKGHRSAESGNAGRTGVKAGEPRGNTRPNWGSDGGVPGQAAELER
ncbi:hypothetical protein [Mesorhizobium sp. WSM4904]|uniref:hypothetical protein n=1 Tax=Mesorhizobium sp. WSM4904 TaxID=3038545 RepID=UPI00241854D9|nr:hypothetical protein [Mesorhizobium sp. WSM4904]WFP62197.1 hypothetical protein QAZ47_27680 [Mesorhizobium sp. WSM4904]